MMNGKTKRWHNLAKTTLIVFLVLNDTSVRAFGQCETDEGPFQIANIQSTTNGWIILTWEPTCTNFIFGVFSADGLLSTNPLWVGRIGAWGDASGTMSWTDTTASVNCRFFKAVRILPTNSSDWDADDLPDAWEADYGLNPFDPCDAHTDADSDGVDNLAEYLQGRDPIKGAVADTGGFVNLEVYTRLD